MRLLQFLTLLQTYIKLHPRLSKVLFAFFVVHLYRKWRHKRRALQTQFSTKNEMSAQAILITGCDTGFGHKLALDLHKRGYCVIATCLREESVQSFMHVFNSNGINQSVSFTLDISNLRDIQAVKQKVIQYLETQQKSLWAIVNNAGIATVGPFELLSDHSLQLYAQVLLIGHWNITREFLPLMAGRQRHRQTIHNQNNRVDDVYSHASGGRIVNISSASTVLPSPVWLLYGSLKCALSYWSHALRMELLPRFQIYCSVIEPGGFSTNIWNSAVQAMDGLKQSADPDVWHDYDMDAVLSGMKVSVPRVKARTNADLSPVTNAIIHAITSKYPEPRYRPGWRLDMLILRCLPMSARNSLIMYVYKKAAQT